MEKKSIGRFIAALRKANGMTQKELAEKLNVSDKSVSRWERDEGAPDLSLIPVIAEIFGVTSDEILRGERINQAMTDNARGTEKSEKQIARLINSTQTKFQIRSLISVGITGIGLLAAMICNFGFYRANLGFLIACIFYLTAIICESVFLSLAISAINNTEFENVDFEQYKKAIGKQFATTLQIIVYVFTASLPLVLFTSSAFHGLPFGQWILLGAPIVVTTMILCTVIKWILSLALSKKGIFELSRKETESIKWKLKRIVTMIIVLLVTFFIQLLFNEVTSAQTFAKGRVFDNFEDFKTFMEIENDPDGEFDPDATYYDEFGNEITFEEAMTQHIYDNDGNILYEYIHLNQEAQSISYSNTSDCLPITVYTSEDLSEGHSVIDGINFGFICLYVLEIILGLFFVLEKSKK
ncbi:MAG: helix-turn-helix transcriptional regulator [Lachnospiraceae bacterium]|nr:helix-turn-helix transcriptional regulator [Lachnospiraceae bacterium]